MSRPSADASSKVLALVRDLRRRFAVGAMVRRWIQHFRHGEAASSPVVSQTVRQDLDRANAALEHVFLQLSRKFEPLAERMQGLVSSSESLRELASGRQEGETLFQRAIGVLHGPLEFIDRCSSRHTRLLELLKQCEDEMGIMLRFQSQMSDLLAPLSFVEVLFRVESAPLELDQRETFGTVAADINRLRQLVNDAFQKNSGLLASTNDTLGKVRRRLEHDFQLHARAIADKRRDVDSLLTRLDEQLVRNARQETDAQALMRKLSTQVSSVVSSLQYQDIIKQKCSHVVDALADWEDHHVYDRAFVKLQVAQLRTVDEEMTRAVAGIESGVHSIRDLGESIDRRSLSMDDYEGMIASADGMVQMLLDSLRDTHAIVAGTTALITEASDAARPAGNIAANLTSTLGELSINMRLVALNAQVRSVQITQVTGLEVLAVRTAEISNRITGVSREVSTRLVRLRAVTDEMFKLFDDFGREGRDWEGRMTLEKAPVEQELHSLRDQTLSVFGSMSQTVEQVKQAAGELHAVLGQAPEAHLALNKAIDDLTAFAERYCSGDSLSGRAAELAAAQATTYTMASEREVHDAIAGAHATNRLRLAGAADAAARALALEGRPAGAGAPAGRCMSGASSNSGEVELF